MMGARPLARSRGRLRVLLIDGFDRKTLRLHQFCGADPGAVLVGVPDGAAQVVGHLEPVRFAHEQVIGQVLLAASGRALVAHAAAPGWSCSHSPMTCSMRSTEGAQRVVPDPPGASGMVVVA